MDIPKKKLDRLYAAAAEALSYFQVCNAMDRTNFPVAKGLPPSPPPAPPPPVQLEEARGELQAAGYNFRGGGFSVLA